ncbi:MAG: carboxylating nicotinate-nucleotide diphosphorylase [archaeon]|jgi:nicotinate-nucleotide pyrophosphorylase (carboxylating)|nr:carboxylating nicotinate-nucleotide diphosphorylase [archaeon]
MISAEMKRQLSKILFDDLSFGDVTSAITPLKRCRARIVARELCVLAGVEEASYLFKLKHIKPVAKQKDGQKIRANSTVFSLSGTNRQIFNVERTALNVLSRMSAVATVCSEAQKIVGKRIKIATTRKTMPGFNLFDNHAAEIAGVWSYRLNLNSFVLLKDNHLPFFEKPSDAVLAAREAYGNDMVVDLEVDSLPQALDAITAKPDILMLDNFAPGKAKAAVKKLRAKGFRGKIELSGGITFKNIKRFKGCGANIISMGALTQGIASKNFSLEIL